MAGWEQFTHSQRVELCIALDHRIGEAETGNMYADWECAGELLLSLFQDHPELTMNADGDEVTELRRRLIYLRNTR